MSNEPVFRADPASVAATAKMTIDFELDQPRGDWSRGLDNVGEGMCRYTDHTPQQARAFIDRSFEQRFGTTPVDYAKDRSPRSSLADRLAWLNQQESPQQAQPRNRDAERQRQR